MKDIFKAKLEKIEAVAQEFPGVIIITSIKYHSVEYMSPRGVEILKTSLPEIQALGGEYVHAFFNPEDADDYVPVIVGLMEKGDENEVISFFQQVRASKSDPWMWYLTSTKIFHKNKSGEPTHLINFACPVDPAHNVNTKVDRLLEENRYIKDHFLKYVKLTKREKEIVQLLAKGVRTPEIAGQLFLSPATIDQHRKNIKSKLETKTLPELVKFAQAFDLV